MRVQLFSDIHGDLAALRAAISVEADLYICAGDLANWAKGLDACGEILGPLAEKLWILPGNHETEGQIADLCERFGFRNFHGRSFDRDGRAFAGLGYSSPTPFDTPGEYSEEELAERLAHFEDLDSLVLVCHSPPRETDLDEAGPGQHYGSHAVRQFVDRKQPDYLFCGHIHEAAGREAKLGRTVGRNLGKKGYLLEL